jgi:Holliday junction resolvase RusA-like endonuclease
MTFTFAMQGRLESLNTTERDQRNPYYRFYAARKRKMIKRHIAQWIIYSRVPKFEVPVRIHIQWVERDRRRDLDNIRAGSKVLLDALVKMGRIKNDSQKWVVALTDSYQIDKANPRVEVTISDAAVASTPTSLPARA